MLRVILEKVLVVSCFFVLLTIPFVVDSQATSISGLFNTGVDNSNVLLANGATDPHYTLITSADPSFPGPSTFVVNSSAYPLASGPWIADGPNSKWIGPTANPDLTATPAGLYVYQTTFNLTGNPSSAVITGEWTSDNNAVIFLNGNNTGITDGSAHYGAFSTFTINSGFVAGLNTLDFDVTNAPEVGGLNPTGLRVEFSGTSAPEPCVILLLGFGLAGLAAFRKKFRS